jgi:prophage regulatory protein
MGEQNREAIRILRRPQVEARTGLSCSSIYLAIAEGTFPKPVRLGLRAVGWIEDEIVQWIDAKVEQSRRAA